MATETMSWSNRRRRWHASLAQKGLAAFQPVSVTLSLSCLRRSVWAGAWGHEPVDLASFSKQLNHVLLDPLPAVPSADDDQDSGLWLLRWGVLFEAAAETAARGHSVSGAGGGQPNSGVAQRTAPIS